ncbi:MAG: hypothetical protein GC159_14050 [Phycisphaera sp.]|nr:hypothetical protein [Phycisphaera sp.]
MDQPGSHTVLWTSDRCKRIADLGDVGKPLRVVFGGSHRSMPRLSPSVAEGDFVYPLYVADKQLHVIGRLTVSAIMPIEAYLDDVLQLDEHDQQRSIQDLESTLLAERSAFGHQIPYGCVLEAAIGEGTAIRLDNVVPPDMLERIYFVTRRGDQPIQHVENGRLVRVVSLQGNVRRLAPASAAEFAALVG